MTADEFAQFAKVMKANQITSFKTGEIEIKMGLSFDDINPERPGPEVTDEDILSSPYAGLKD